MNQREFSVMLQAKAANSRKVKQFAVKAKAVLLAEYEPHRDTGELAASVQIVQRKNKQGVSMPFIAVTREHIESIERGHWAGKGENTVWVNGIHGVAKAAKKLRRMR